MQRPPLQVDTVTSGWDILGALGDFFGGIFAGGALLIAALAYSREIDNRRRQQASKVIIRRKSADDAENLVLLIVNGSDEPVQGVSWNLEAAHPGDKTRSILGSASYLGSFEELPLELANFTPDAAVAGSISFTDATGKDWERELGGALHRLRKSYRRSRSNQASRLWVMKSFDGDQTVVTVSNKSRYPVYDVRVMQEQDFLSGEMMRQVDERIMMVGPYSARKIFFKNLKLEGARVGVAFTDAFGRKWLRRSDGNLSSRDRAFRAHKSAFSPGKLRRG